MNDINSIISKNFNDNIKYLQEKHLAVFEKISALESAIEKGHYSEKYALVFENNGFDVYEQSTDTYLYDKNSLKHTQLVQKSIDYKIKDNLFEGFHKQELSIDAIKKYKTEELFKSEMGGFAPIINFIQENSSEDKSLKSIDKFIFFGTGLALHIEAIDKIISSKVYFIIEDDLELFRLSLFTINYKNLSRKSTLNFSIFENNSEFSRSAKLFLNKSYYYNQYIKFFSLLSHSDEKRNQFHIEIGSQSHMLFFYNDLLNQYLTPLSYLVNEYKFLNSSTEFVSDKPFLLLAAGPSLKKNREWLKKNHHKFVIVAVTATLSFLEEENISPDIITHLDAFEGAALHTNKVQSFEFLKDSICIFSARTHDNVMSKFDKEQIFLYENGTEYKEDSLRLSGACVGSATYQMLLKLNVKNLYLLGLDLAIDSITGETHSSSDIKDYVKTLDTEGDAFDNEVITFKSSTFEFEGNFHKTAITTPNFKISIDSINNSTHFLKQSYQNIYNLSDGVKFEGSTPLHMEDVVVDDSNLNKHDIYKVCRQNSSVGLSEEESISLYEKLSHAKRVQKVLRKYLKQDKKNILNYLKNLQKLTSQITSDEDRIKYDLSRIVDTYFKYILPYIFDFLNDKSLEKNTPLSKEIDILFSNHLEKIINHYIRSLEPLFLKDETVAQGVVETQDGILYTGWYKGLDKSNRIDVYIDNNYEKTLRVNQENKYLNRIYEDSKFGFSYFMDEKYFDGKEHSIDFKLSETNTILVTEYKKFKLESCMIDEIALYRFEESLKSVDEEKIKDLYMKDCIGFLAVEENLEDEDFVNYIKELYLRFPQVTFKAFYFSDEQKILFERIFRMELNRFEVIIPSAFRGLIQEIQIYIGVSSIKQHLINYMVKKNCNNIFFREYTSSIKGIKLRDIDTSLEYRRLVEMKNIFSIPVNSLDDNLFNLLNKYVLFSDTDIAFAKVNLNQSQYESRFFTTVKYALESLQYIRNFHYYIKVFNNK